MKISSREIWEADLDAVRAKGLYRELRRVDSAQGAEIELNGKALLNFSSNDYLGLANHPALKAAAIRAIEQYGTGSGASRLVCGSLAPHHELEEALASFKSTEAAVTFSSGYATALGTITSLVGKEDILILDKLVHASIIDAARLSGARLRVYAHNDLNELETILQWADRQRSSAISGSDSAGVSQYPSAIKPRVLIVTESVFSMDGDRAPLTQIVELKERYGAWLMLDEAHATGFFGRNGRGLAEEAGVSDRVEIQMGTLGKALGAAGGFICGSRALIDLLINRARSFIFSTAPMPAAAAAGRAGLQIIQSTEGRERVAQLWRNIGEARQLLASSSFASPPQFGTSAILPLIIGDEQRAVALAGRLREQGIFVPAIRYPTVARGAARMRVTLNSAHTRDQIKSLSDALARALDVGVTPLAN
ncbi:MAG: 8-amino-7-oxononanoate synthase [Verrucomicrobiota bacterium]